ncbi:MAG: hypothetical protein DCC49_00650 [Acidobacteria bacterium]|nr:MAG: hypothetical protein DCC49_00650 [Acidobacteriota bacterium]
MNPDGLAELISGKEMVVTVGSGGVGKTSISATMALHAASTLGIKVLVITVDPARRLADALGVAGLGNLESQVSESAFNSAGLPIRGELWAVQLDTKRSWDDLVMRYAASEEEAFKILENPLYQGFSARFIQSHDYIAMERLYDLHSQGNYDLIVVDTPPSRNAVDFVEAPKRVQEFFGGRLLRLLTVPYRVGGDFGGRVINFAAKPFYRIADQILGSQFLEDIAEFFLSFQSMYEGFTRRAAAIETLLKSRQTTFVVVSTLEPAAFAEAQYFCELLTRNSMPVGALILNKVLPEYLLDVELGRKAELLSDSSLSKSVAASIGVAGEKDKERMLSRVLQEIAENFTNFQTVALREAEEERSMRYRPDVVAKVPFVPTDLVDLDGLSKLASGLFGDGSGEGGTGEKGLTPPADLEARRQGRGRR